MPIEVFIAELPAPHVVLRGAGDVTREDLRRMLEETLRLSVQLPANRILADLVEMDARHSISDLYWTVRELEERGVPRGDFREAILVRSVADAGEHVEFFELAARNRGYDVRVFDSRLAAMTWLCPSEVADALPPSDPVDGRGP